MSQAFAYKAIASALFIIALGLRREQRLGRLAARIEDSRF